MKTTKQYKKLTNHQLTPNGTTVDLGLALTCDVDYDPDSLLGNRFLCRGSGGLLVAQSGVGKSTFAFQLACHAAVGKDFFGIRSTNKGPLKVVLIQSENDAFEIAEVLQSVTEHWSPSEIAMLERRLVVEIVWNKLGKQFGTLLRNITPKHNPDLVIVDPLMGFLGADVLSNEAITSFMREHVNDALKNPPEGCRRFGLIFVHHTGKPVASGRKDEKPTSAFRMYNMMGASELVNWARCIMRIDAATEKGRFQFLVVKRGNRSGVSYLPNEDEWGCTLRHSEPNPVTLKRVLRWELAQAPQDQTAVSISDEEVKLLPIKLKKKKVEQQPPASQASESE